LLVVSFVPAPHSPTVPAESGGAKGEIFPLLNNILVDCGLPLSSIYHQNVTKNQRLVLGVERIGRYSCQWKYFGLVQNLPLARGHSGCLTDLRFCGFTDRSGGHGLIDRMDSLHAVVAARGKVIACASARTVRLFIGAWQRQLLLSARNGIDPDNGACRDLKGGVVRVIGGNFDCAPSSRRVACGWLDVARR
jgi:hypothetical protein